MVGSANTADGNHAFVWDQANGYTQLGNSAIEDTFGRARRINNAGQVIGEVNALTPGAQPQGTLWQAGTAAQDIGDLPGGFDSSTPRGLNDLGQVVGRSWTAAGPTAFTWQQSTGIVNLNDLPGISNAAGAGNVNNAGQIVGASSVSSGGKAFLWDPVSGVTDLGHLTGTGRITSPSSINDVGQVVGIRRSFLLTPGAPQVVELPEPAPLGLLALGACALLLAGRARKDNVQV